MKDKLSYRIVRWTVRHTLVPLLMHLHIDHIERLPATGPYLIAANHISMIDPPLLMDLLPRQPRVIARDDLFTKPVIGFILRWADAIPVRRGTPDRSAIRAALDVVRAGHAVGIFPEGTRIKTGGLAVGMPGVGLIALRTKVPVVPVSIQGTDRILRGKLPHLRTPVTIRFGEPISPKEIQAVGGVQKTTDLIMTRIAELLPPEKRGVYTTAVEAADAV